MKERNYHGGQQRQANSHTAHMLSETGAVYQQIRSTFDEFIDKQHQAYKSTIKQKKRDKDKAKRRNKRKRTGR